MSPDYLPGVRVVTFNWTQLSVDDVVVLVDDNMNLIKRIVDYKDSLYLLKGDNVKESTVVYKVDRSKIIGKVIYKY